MIFKNAELYNVGDLLPEEDGGYRICRVRSDVRDHMSEGGKNLSIAATGVEIRFVINSGTVKITLRSNIKRRLLVMYGALHGGMDAVAHSYGTENTTLEISPCSDIPTLTQLTDMCGYGYSPNVVRLLPESASRDVIVDIEGDIRPPRPDEVPSKRFMVYGSSITHGFYSLMQTNTYVYQLGRKLGYDPYNLGFAGSCALEKEVADYISENGTERNERSWDFAVLELGINTLTNVKMDDEEFGRRAKYLLDVMTEKNPGKKLFVTDIYPHLGELSDNGATESRRQALRRQVEGRDNVIFVPGKEILTSFEGLSYDGIHPNVDGMAEIANNWYKVIKANI